MKKLISNISIRSDGSVMETYKAGKREESVGALGEEYRLPRCRARP